MRFSKSYSQILLSLPPEFRENAINYCQLEELINQVVQELTLLGFSPEVIRGLFAHGNDILNAMREKRSSNELTAAEVQSYAVTRPGQKLLYEVDNDLDHLVPRLRLIVDAGTDVDTAPYIPVLASLENPTANSSVREYIIPLVSDAAFFDLLTSAMSGLSAQLTTVHSEFMAALANLSKSISDSALPISQINPSYRPFSAVDDPGAIAIPSTKPVFGAGLDAKSDLYLWRHLLTLYVEAEVFDSVAEINRGERSFEDAEVRMAQFLERVEKSGILRGKSKKAYIEVETFLRLNKTILDLKKLNYASSEGIRKLLKKRAKRTALPFPPSLPHEIVSAVGVLGVELPTTSSSVGPTSQALILPPHHPGSLPRLLVGAIGETILPIIPHLDDYSCLICTSIAFKPIRLSCQHLFCIRCLVKLQKQGESNCPMCRSPSVGTADRSNVDWALMNFMVDWFPMEAREKQLSNEREASAETARELGLDKNGCFVM